MAVPKRVGVPWKVSVEVAIPTPTTSSTSQITITFPDLKNIEYATCDAATVKASFVSASGNVATFDVFEYAYAAAASGAAVAYPASTALPGAVNAVAFGE